MPKISIITINFNNSKGLKKTFESVFAQSYKDFEYIVIDGGSNDGSKEVIEFHQNNIDYWVSEKDNGIYHAMNKGIQAAKGDYLLFMNSGDVLLSDINILEICHSKLNENIVAFDCFLRKENQIIGKRTHVEKPTLFYVFKNGFKHQSTFIKRSLFKNLGFYNEKFRIAGDYEFWIRCFLEKNTTAKGYNIPIAIFQLDGISQNGHWGLEHEQIIQEHLPHLIFDFKHFEKLLPFENSKLLNIVIITCNFIKRLFTIK